MRGRSSSAIASGACARPPAWGRAAPSWSPCCWADRIAERLRAAQGVIGCAKSYGAARLEAACERALGHDSPHYRTVKSILATGADLQPLVEPETPAAYGRARFARSAAELFGAEPGTLH